MMNLKETLRLERLAVYVMAWCAFLIVLVVGFAAGAVAYALLTGAV